MERAETAFSRRDAFFVLAALLVSYLFCELILFGGLGLSVPIFTAFFYAAVLLYLKPVMSRAAVWSMVPVALISLCFVIYDNEGLRLLNVLALTALTCANLTVFTYGQKEGDKTVFNGQGILDCLKTLFVFPLCNLNKSVKAVGTISQNRSKWKTAAKIILSLVVVSPVILLVLQLLMSSDSNYNHLVRTLLDRLSDQAMSYAAKILIALLLSFPLFSLLYSLRKSANQSKGERKTDQPTLGNYFQIADSVATITALTVFILIYLTYLILQFGYLFAAFSKSLPAGFTYAEYARRGFFELMAVAFINLLLTGAAVLLTKKHENSMSRGCKFCIAALSVTTLLIISTALAKMFLYISIFDLTPLRIYTSWFMVVLAFLFILILMKTAAPRFNFVRSAWITAVVLYLLLNFSNTDRLIANYNITRYQNNSSRSIDVELLNSLSDSVVPELVRLKDDPNYGGKVAEVLQRRKVEISRNSSWKNFSFAQMVAKNIVQD